MDKVRYFDCQCPDSIKYNFKHIYRVSKDLTEHWCPPWTSSDHKLEFFLRQEKQILTPEITEQQARELIPEAFKI